MGTFCSKPERQVTTLVNASPRTDHLIVLPAWRPGDSLPSVLYLAAATQ